MTTYNFPSIESHIARWIPNASNLGLDESSYDSFLLKVQIQVWFCDKYKKFIHWNICQMIWVEWLFSVTTASGRTYIYTNLLTT